MKFSASSNDFHGREMVANLGGFLGVLAGWKRREREEEAAARAAGGAR